MEHTLDRDSVGQSLEEHTVRSEKRHTERAARADQAPASGERFVAQPDGHQRRAERHPGGTAKLSAETST
jgi:hypothetical protein